MYSGREFIAKYLIQISVREPHNNLITSKDEGGLSIVCK